jgi:arylsulfatase A-like enzyme
MEREPDVTARPNEFAGRIGVTAADSQPWWPTPPTPPAGAPNILVIVLDDTGFAQLGCFGAPIDTPNIDRLAANGQRYTNFHVTPLCSPTRASLLTGRNNHTVGMGCLADFDTGFPSQSGAISHSAATIAEMLKPHGYVNYAVGKWHLVPSFNITPVGPFDQWPLGRGFDHYYGFLWGESDQYRPQLWRDNHHAETPQRPDYHVSEDFVDEAIHNISDHVTSGTQNPFLMYLAFGAQHAPHQAPKTYIDKYKGRFDSGWDRVREDVLKRQIELGVVPEGTQLPPSNDDVRPWDSLGAEERRLYARMQEAFAGMMDHTDAQIGRLLDFLEREQLTDDTLVVLMSDNGASGEGGPSGSANEYRYFLNQPDTLEENLEAIDLIGSPATHNHYPTGWAQAGNTPNKYYKKFTHAGGVRAPMIISWPPVVTDVGVRSEFRHVTDIVPTLLDAVGVAAPAQYNGIEQLPVTGESFLAGLRDATGIADRSAPQYFEMIGNRAIWRDGYKAVTRHVEGADYESDRWELYDLRSDFSEVHDLADAQPALLEELKELWFAEAERFDVFPLDDRLQGRADVRPSFEGEERRTFRMLPGTQPITSQAAPDFYDRSFEIIASVEREKDTDEGVLIAQGHHANGWSFYVKDRRLVLDYNFAGRHTVIRSEPVVPRGASRLRMTFERTGSAQADVRLWIGEESVASHDGLHTIPNFFGPHSVQVARNAPSPVGDDYAAPFDFGGVLHSITVNLGSDKGASADAFLVALSTE